MNDRYLHDRPLCSPNFQCERITQLPVTNTGLRYLNLNRVVPVPVSSELKRVNCR